MSSNIDIPGYALIYGGEHNGKYVDANGRYHTRVGNVMYAADTGDLAPIADAGVQPGQVIGQPSGEQRHFSDAEIANRTRYSGDGIDEVLKESVKEHEQMEQALERAEESASEQAAEEQASATTEDAQPQDESMPRDAGAPAPDVTADDLVAKYSAAELLAMVQDLKAQLDKAGVENDIKPRKGGAESSIRYNAEAIAQYAEA